MYLSRSYRCCGLSAVGPSAVLISRFTSNNKRMFYLALSVGLGWAGCNRSVKMRSC